MELQDLWEFHKCNPFILYLWKTDWEIKKFALVSLTLQISKRQNPEQNSGEKTDSVSLSIVQYKHTLLSHSSITTVYTEAESWTRLYLPREVTTHAS